MKLAQLAPLSFLMVTTACTSLPPNQVRFTVNTEPPGAMLYEGNVSWGMAPQTRIYTGNLQVGQIQTRPITAIWPSGARESQFFNLPMQQGDRQATISRPMNAPGLDKDLAFAAQLRAIRAQEDAAAAAAAAAYSTMMDSDQSIRRTNTTCIDMGGGIISCTSR